MITPVRTIIKSKLFFLMQGIVQKAKGKGAVNTTLTHRFKEAIDLKYRNDMPSANEIIINFY